MNLLTKNHATLRMEVEAHIAADAVVAGHYWNDEVKNAVGGTGCFIGCLSHGSQASDVQDRFGLPLPLVRIAEGIFEALPSGDGKAFFAAIPDAVGSDGKDLSLVHWAFLASELRALPSVPSHIQDVIDPVIAGMDLLAGGGEWPACACACACACAYDAAAYAYDADADAAAAGWSAAAYASAASAARWSAAAAADSDADADADADSDSDSDSDAASAARWSAAAAGWSAAAYAAAADAARWSAAAADAARLRQRDTLLKLISKAPIAAEAV